MQQVIKVLFIIALFVFPVLFTWKYFIGFFMGIALTAYVFIDPPYQVRIFLDKHLGYSTSLTRKMMQNDKENIRYSKR